MELLHGPPMSARRMLWDLRENLWSCVPASHLAWAKSITTLVCSRSRFCSQLIMVAVGGPACDREIAFICDLLPRLGFSTVVETVDDNEQWSREWKWTLPRLDADDYEVALWQFQDVESVVRIEQHIATVGEHIQRP